MSKQARLYLSAIGTRHVILSTTSLGIASSVYNELYGLSSERSVIGEVGDAKGDNETGG